MNKRWYLESRLYAGAAILLLLAAVAGLWRQWNAIPVVHIPTPVMPHPNAFDYYVKAAKAIPSSLNGVQYGGSRVQREEVTRTFLQVPDMRIVSPRYDRPRQLSPTLASIAICQGIFAFLPSKTLSPANGAARWNTIYTISILGVRCGTVPS
jgi:hypothetical protein